MNIFGRNMTRQEIFDEGVKAILDQGQPALDYGGSCMYRTADGCKCLVGHLIPDSEYRSEAMEHANANQILDLIGDDGEFVNQLQRCHDGAAWDVKQHAMVRGPEFIERFRRNVEAFAIIHDLNTTVLQ